MKIAKINYHSLRNDAHFQLNTEIRKLILEEGADKLRIKKQFEELFERAYKREDEALKKISKSAHTENMIKADAARDDVFSGMVEIISAYTKHYNPSVRESARKVKIITDTYGNIARKPLNEETSAIYNLLQDLSKVKNEAKAIKIDDWVAELEKANKEFDGIVRERIEESAMKTDVVLRDARKELDAAVRKIFSLIEAAAVMFDSADYVNFMRRVNVVIAKYGGKSVKLGVEFVGGVSAPLNDQTTDDDEIDEVEQDEYDLSKIKDYDPEEHYTQLKVGDLRKHYDVVYKVIDLGQCHYPPYSKLGPLGWERMN